MRFKLTKWQLLQAVSLNIRITTSILVKRACSFANVAEIYHGIYAIVARRKKIAYATALLHINAVIIFENFDSPITFQL
jgi:hypothetical protein